MEKHIPETSPQIPGSPVSRFGTVVFSLFGMLVLGYTFFAVKGTIDFHLHDTYYVIESKPVFYRLSTLMFIFCALYFLGAPFLGNRLLVYVHCLFTLFFLLIVLGYFGSGSEAGMPAKYVDYAGEARHKEWRQLELAAVAGIILFFAGVLCFVINYLIGIRNHRRGR